MKRVIILVITLVLAGCTTIDRNKGIAVEFKTGIVSSADCEKIEHSDLYPIKRDECRGIAVTTEAHRVKIVVGQNFGVEYLLSNLSKKNCYELTHKLVHPAMIDSEGRERTEYSRSTNVGQCYNEDEQYWGVFSWYVEEDWESVEGPWIFSIMIDGTPLLSEVIYAH